MKKLNTKLTIPKLRTVCKYQQNTSSTVKNWADTDPTGATATVVSGIIGAGW